MPPTKNFGESTNFAVLLYADQATEQQNKHQNK